MDNLLGRILTGEYGLLSDKSFIQHCFHRRMFSLEKQFVLFFLSLTALFASFSSVSADANSAGNVLAGLIGMVIGIVLICSVLGWWSRRGERQHQPTGGQ
jgi:hypothetical protein